MNEEEQSDKSHPVGAPELPEEIARRRFLERFCVVLGAGVFAALSVPPIGFILAPLLQRNPRLWRPVGNAESFKPGETVAVTFEDASPQVWAGVTARTGAWLRRQNDGSFVAFSINCSHLGCPVRWLPEADLFMCPCHGGVYYKDGTVAAGPPPRPLTRYPVRINQGQVEIQTGPIPISGRPHVRPERQITNEH